MGGMFSVLKVRKDQKPGDYTDPGWYAQPPGTRAWEWTGDALAVTRPAAASGPAGAAPVTVRKPSGHAGH
jgi:hypothetical protein